MENIRKYNEIFMDVFSVEEDMLNVEFTNENVENWNSIHQLNLISYVEEVFDVILDTEDIIAFSSYEVGKTIMAKYGVII